MPSQQIPSRHYLETKTPYTSSERNKRKEKKHHQHSLLIVLLPFILPLKLAARETTNPRPPSYNCAFLSEIALPQDPLEIFKLLSSKSLHINLPSILPRLLKLTQDALDALPDGARVAGRTTRKRSQDLR